MFPSYGSVPRHSPSLLTGFLGEDFPAFYRYYESAKTAEASSRIASLSLTLRYLACFIGFVFYARRSAEAPDATPGHWSPGYPNTGYTGQGRSTALPASWGILLCVRHGLRPRSTRSRLAIYGGRYCPETFVSTRRRRWALFRGSIRGIRTRCLRFVPPLLVDDARLASGRWPIITGWDLPI